MTENIDFMRGWLSGLFDGDGTVGHTKRRDRPSDQRYLQMGNTDRSIVAYAARCLRKLKIPFSIYHSPRTPPRKDVYVLSIHGADNIIRFYELVGFQCNYKAKRLQESVDWWNRPNAVRRSPPPSREEIEALYYGESLSYLEVGKRLGYTGSGSGIRHRMLKLGIPIRSASESRRLGWRKDGPRRQSK